MNAKLMLLDNVAMKFEEAWTSEQGVDSVFAFARCEPIGQLSLAEVIGELVIVDIERRWQEWNATEMAKLKSKAILQSLAKIPRCEEYLCLAESNQIFLSPEKKNEIESTEFVSRMKYGDAPKPTASIALDFEESNFKLCPRIAIHIGGQERFEDGFYGTIQVGRQAMGEPAAPTWFESNQGTKLVCVDGHEALVSRTQFSVSMVNAKFAIVENISTNRHFAIVGNEVLPPRQEGVFKLPISVDLDKVMITVSRDG